MSFRSTEDWVACKGPGCACWETTKRKREEMEHDVTNHKGFISNATLADELKSAGWYVAISGATRSTEDGRYFTTIYRYTDILEGECGLTHPRGG